MDIRFTVKMDPASKARARFTNKGGKIRSYTPNETLAAERIVAASFRAVAGGYKPEPGKFYSIEATFYCGTRQRRDVDNMAKLLLDGLNGVAYPDDNAVLDLHVSKRYVARSEARTEVRIWETGDDDVNMVECAREGCENTIRTYESWRSVRRFCSQECNYQARADAKERTCQNCETTFHTHGASRDTKFCSLACRDAFGRAEVPCSVCSTTIEKPKSKIRQSNYCSDECRNKRAAERAAERRAKKYPGTCEICGGGTSRKEIVRCIDHRENPGPKAGVKRGPYKKDAVVV